MSKNIFWVHGNNHLLIWLSKDIRQSKTITKYLPPCNIIIISLKDILISPCKYQIYNLRIKATPLKWINNSSFFFSFVYPNANFVLDQPTVRRLVRQQAFSILGPLAMASDSKSMFPTSQGCIDEQVRGASVDAFSGVGFYKVWQCCHL